VKQAVPLAVSRPVELESGPRHHAREEAIAGAVSRLEAPAVTEPLVVGRQHVRSSPVPGRARPSDRSLGTVAGASGILQWLPPMFPAPLP
jgi:hypothetical protein